MEAVGFVLARTPERFPRIPGTSLSAITVSFYDGMPSVLFLFSYDEHKVRMIGVEFECDKSAGFEDQD